MSAQAIKKKYILFLKYTDYVEIIFKQEHLDHPLVVGVSIDPGALLEAIKV